MFGEAADLTVAQAVVAEGEDLARDGDSGDLGAAAFGDPFILGARRPAAGGGVLRGLAQRPAQDRGALAGDVCRGEPCRQSCARSGSAPPTGTGAWRWETV